MIGPYGDPEDPDVDEYGEWEDDTEDLELDELPEYDREPL